MALAVAVVAASCAGTSSADVVVAGASRSRVAPPATTSTTIAAAVRCADTLTPDQQAAQLVMVLVRDPAAASDSNTN